jgi:hypothetical protein
MTNNAYVLLRGVYYRKRAKTTSFLEMLRHLWRKDKSIEAELRPKYMKVYDNGGATLDRYTIIYTRKKVNDREYLALKLSDEPDDQFHNKHTILLDKASSSNVPMAGKEIPFEKLPHRCQEIAQEYYADLWKV